MSDPGIYAIYLLPPVVWLVFNARHIVWSTEAVLVVTLMALVWPWTVVVHLWTERHNG